MLADVVQFHKKGLTKQLIRMIIAEHGSKHAGKTVADSVIRCYVAQMIYQVFDSQTCPKPDVY